MQPHTSPNEEKSLKEGKHAGKSMVTSKEKEQAELRTDEAEGDHKFISKLAMAKVDKTFGNKILKTAMIKRSSSALRPYKRVHFG